jgi:hypothetical protein
VFADILKYPPVCQKTNASAGAAEQITQIKEQKAKRKTTMQKSKMKPIGPHRAYLNAGTPFFGFDLLPRLATLVAAASM